MLQALFVLALSVVNNWLVPLTIYASKFGLFKKRPKEFIGCNDWGVVMDVILAGAINLTIWQYLLTIDPVIRQEDLVKALLGGFGFMVVTHFWMAVTFWKEWIMPEPFRWNAGGYWHMVSMTLQMAYAFYPLVLLVNDPSLLWLPATRQLVILVTVFGLFFLGALRLKDETIKLGPLVVDGRPW